MREKILFLLTLYAGLQLQGTGHLAYAVNCDGLLSSDPISLRTVLAVDSGGFVKWQTLEHERYAQLATLSHERHGLTFNPNLGGDLSNQPYLAISIYPESTSIISESELGPDSILKFVQSRSTLLNDPMNGIGVWRDESGAYYLDVVVVLPNRTKNDLKQAKKLGARFNQRAVFDLENSKLIPLAGSGTASPHAPSATKRSHLVREILNRDN